MASSFFAREKDLTMAEMEELIKETVTGKFSMYRNHLYQSFLPMQPKVCVS